MTPQSRLAMLSRVDLPEEVKRELCKVSPRDWMRVQILGVMHGKAVMCIDEIIVSLWVEFKRISTRKVVCNRLSEMCETGEIERVKNGHYRLPEETT